MSRLRTSALKWAPDATEGLPISPGTTAWVNGDWVPFFAATTADDTAIAGIVIQDVNGWAGLQLEAEFGIGLEGQEVRIGHIRIHGPNSGNGGPTQYRIPWPISGIVPGTRVSMRLRHRGTGSVTWLCSVAYYEDLDSDQAIPYTTATLTSFPSGEDSIQLTPSATPWDNSDWGEFNPIVGEPTYVFGMAMENPADAVDVEVDLGDGAPGGGGEVERTTFRYGSYADGRLNFANLPGLMPITTGRSMVGRMRKSGTGTTTTSFAFLGYTGPLELPTADGGVIGPLLWVTMSFRPPVV